MQKDFSQLGYVGSLNTVDRNEWYTPLKYIKAARQVLGDIDFDPFSDERANEVVQANVYRGKNDPRKWLEVHTVWMNPPYGRGLIESAIEEFCVELYAQQFEAIVLVNNATETRWFQQLLDKMDAVCLTHHRIAFTSEDDKAVSGNTRGQAFFYFGVDSALFDHEFRKFGMILKKH